METKMKFVVLLKTGHEFVVTADTHVSLVDGFRNDPGRHAFISNMKLVAEFWDVLAVYPAVERGHRVRQTRKP
jgi:hypothetical protein